MNKSIQHALQLGAYGLVLTCGACNQGEVETSTGEPGEVETPATEPVELGKAARPVSESDKNAASIGDLLSKQVSDAVADLSSRMGIPADAIVARQASIVTWGSSAVGCPKEGMNYTQVIVPGILVLLEANGKIYRYHGNNKSELFHCPDDRAEAPAYGSGEEFM